LLFILCNCSPRDMSKSFASWQLYDWPKRNNVWWVIFKLDNWVYLLLNGYLLWFRVTDLSKVSYYLLNSPFYFLNLDISKRYALSWWEQRLDSSCSYSFSWWKITLIFYLKFWQILINYTFNKGSLIFPPSFQFRK